MSFKSFVLQKIVFFIFCFALSQFSYAQLIELHFKSEKPDKLLITAKLWKDKKIVKSIARFEYDGNFTQNKIKIDFSNFDSLSNIKIYFSQLNRQNRITLQSFIYHKDSTKIELYGSEILRFFDYNSFFVVEKSNDKQITFRSDLVNGINNSFIFSTRRKLLTPKNSLKRSNLSINLQTSDTITVVLFYDDEPTIRYNNSFAFDFNKKLSKRYFPGQELLNWSWYTVDSLLSYRLVFVYSGISKDATLSIGGIKYNTQNFFFEHSDIKSIQERFYFSETILVRSEDSEKIVFKINNDNSLKNYMATNSITYSPPQTKLFQNPISISVTPSDTVVLKILGSEESKSKLSYPTYDYSLSKDIIIYPSENNIIKQTLISLAPLQELRIIFLTEKKSVVVIDSIKFQTTNNSYNIQKKDIKKLFKTNRSALIKNNGQVILKPQSNLMPMLETWGLQYSYIRLKHKTSIFLIISLFGFVLLLLNKKYIYVLTFDSKKSNKKNNIALGYNIK